MKLKREERMAHTVEWFYTPGGLFGGRQEGWMIKVFPESIRDRYIEELRSEGKEVYPLTSEQYEAARLVHPLDVVGMYRLLGRAV